MRGQRVQHSVTDKYHQDVIKFVDKIHLLASVNNANYAQVQTPDPKPLLPCYVSTLPDFEYSVPVLQTLTLKEVHASLTAHELSLGNAGRGYRGSSSKR
jgi:hypothetical protein